MAPSPLTPPPYRFERRGRTVGTALAVALVWGAMAAMRVGLDAAVWVLAILGLGSLPLVWAFATDRRSAMTVDDHAIRWRAGRTEGEVALKRITQVRFVTRMDFSVRATLVLDTGQRIRLPQESTGPWRPLCAALEARGVATERHHFVTG